MKIARTLPEAGFVDASKLPRGPNGRALCRWCKVEVPKGKRTFCSDPCIHEWKLRSQPRYAAVKVLERDKGVCATCGLDCVALLQELRDTRRSDRFGAFVARCDELQLPKHLRFLSRRLWEMNHRVAVVEGGGSCGLENLETLCWKCHRKHTRALAKRRTKNSPRTSATTEGTVR